MKYSLKFQNKSIFFGVVVAMYSKYVASEDHIYGHYIHTYNRKWSVTKFVCI